MHTWRFIGVYCGPICCVISLHSLFDTIILWFLMRAFDYIFVFVSLDLFQFGMTLYFCRERAKPQVRLRYKRNNYSLASPYCPFQTGF